MLDKKFISLPKDVLKTGEIVEKKSRFLAFAKNVETSEEAEEFYRSIKKEHKTARHTVCAYKLQTLSHFTDDGEPSGTAGKPILDVIEKQGLVNVIVVVVRYFGGIKLGAGPLLRVYSNSASLVLKPPFALFESCQKLQAKITFAQFQNLLKLASKNEIKLENIEFNENVFLTIIAPKNQDFSYLNITEKEEIFYSFKQVEDSKSL